MNALRRLAGTATVMRALPGQRKALFVPREALFERRDARVRETIRHAAKHVAHYRELLAREGIDPREIRGADDLARLPLLTKAEIEPAPRRFVTEGLVAEDGLAAPTGGSSGARITVLHDRGSVLRNIAYAERERMVVEQLLGGGPYRVLQIMRTASTTHAVQDFYARALYRPRRPPRAVLDLPLSLEAIYEEIARVRPDVLLTYGSIMGVVVRDAVRHGRSLAPVRVGHFVADDLPAESRRLAEQELGLPVVAQYNATESFKIGFLCEERDRYHLHDDLCHVVLVDERGTAVGPGERGEVVISNLVNRGMVLLNYRLGDHARLGTEPCACGRSTRVLAELDGLVDEIVRLRDGTLIVPYAIGEAVRRHADVRGFQIVQRELDRFELRLVVADGSYEHVAEAVVAGLREVLRGARVDAVRVDEIQTGGAHRPVVPLP